MSINSPHPLRVAIVEASTLKGRELKSVLSERKFPVKKMVLMDSDENLGRLTEYESEAAVSLAIAESNFEFLDLAFFVEDSATVLNYALLAKKAKFVLIDLTGAFFRDSRVPVYLANQETVFQPFHGLVSSPHSAVISIGIIMRRLSARYPIRCASVNIFDPASERGKKGLDELQQQTLNVFSFQKGPQEIFHQQLAFNLLPRLGDRAAPRLVEAEEMIAAQLRTLLDGSCPLPALTLIQAPIFHSHSFSGYVEFEELIAIDQLENDLTCELLTVSETSNEPPSAIQVDGIDGIHLGGVKRDVLNPNGIWFWAVADNLRLSVQNAVSAAETIFLH